MIQENVDSRIKTHHNQHGQRRGDKKVLNGQEVTRSLTYATIASNFEPELWSYSLMIKLQLVSDVTCVVLQVKQWSFPI